jgi:hypothetical protein
MLANQEPESLHLDYKAKEALLLSQGTSREKRALDVSKDVSAFLNSDGGTIIYGVREATNGQQRLPVQFDPALDGFSPTDLSKEDVENLITSNIQYRPGPELLCITEAQLSKRLVFVVDIAKSYQGAFQAKDKRYYKRFNFKAEPMEHYEIEDVRRRATSPNLELLFGLTDTWRPNIQEQLDYQTKQENVTIHVGLRNRGQVVAETCLLELGLRKYNLPTPLPLPFEHAQARSLRIDGHDAEVPWYLCRWTPQNFERRYTPLFPAVDPVYVTGFTFQVPQGTYSGPHQGVILGVIYWRIQAPNMLPKVGGHFLKYSHFTDTLSLEPSSQSVEVGAPTSL